MLPLRTTAVAVGLSLGVPLASLAAQIDYRNLDRERPVATEDAYPVERHAFELLVPIRSEREHTGDRLHQAHIEAEYGIFDNAEIGIGLPLAVVDPNEADSDWGLAGLSVGGLYNFNTESPALPAVSLAADLALPVGSLGGHAARFSLRGIATRSWGMTRLHFNAVRSFGADDRPGVEFAPRWSYGVAVDRSFFRSSWLVVGELLVRRPVKAEATEVNAAFGLRYQLSPSLVLDAGIARRLRSEAGPDYDLTLGLSHAFALSWLMPGRAR